MGFTITEGDLEQMQNVDVGIVDRSTLKDIRDVKIDPTLSDEERLVDFMEQIGNPYCYKFGKLVVKLSFASDTEDTLEDKLEHYLSTM